MKKTITSLAVACLFSSAAYSQVGVNSTAPKATLDITANATGTTNEGLLIPRLSKTRVAAMTAPENATQIYVDDVASYTGTDPRVIDISGKGFYYYDVAATKWKAIGVGSGGNIYTTDGTLVANREVKLDGKNLGFTGIGNVGLGTPNPALKLHVVDGASDHKLRLQHSGLSDYTDFVKRPSGTFAIYNNTSGNFVGPIAINSSGNVGIGTEHTDQTLDVNGTIYSEKDLLGEGGQIGLGGTAGTNWFIDNATNVFRIFSAPSRDSSGGSVAVSVTSDPNDRMRVEGTITSVDHLLTSDARLKKNIVPVSDALAMVKELKPVEYDKKTNMESTQYDHHEMGFIAQDLQKILPQVVKESSDKDKTLTVNYTALIPLMVKAMQEQQITIEQQQQILQTQQAEIDQLKKQLK